ncbi:hypothetical protein XENOCAPTIV_030838 [Xenoophorus captivus]|uniref:Uncharacterized protein n=1 Tax=Xenoophorus captivus TaxID=1517983 RepID=A0ABV0S410_9TELE
MADFGTDPILVCNYWWRHRQATCMDKSVFMSVSRSDLETGFIFVFLSALCHLCEYSSAWGQWQVCLKRSTTGRQNSSHKKTKTCLLANTHTEFGKQKLASSAFCFLLYLPIFLITPTVKLPCVTTKNICTMPGLSLDFRVKMCVVYVTPNICDPSNII